MPATYENNLMGVKLFVQGPANFDEVNAALGDPNGAMENLMSQLFYRFYNPEVRVLIAEELEARTGTKRRIDTSKKPKRVKNPDGSITEEPVLITEQVFVNELLRDKVLTEDEYEKIVREVAANYGAIRITPDTGRSGKPSKQYMDRAASAISAIDGSQMMGPDGQPVTPEVFASEWSAVNGIEFSTLGTWSQETVAKALRINDERRARAASAQLSF